MALWLYRSLLKLKTIAPFLKWQKRDRILRQSCTIMGNQTQFILKVLAGSALGAILIKYVGPNLKLSGTSTNALILVFLPSIVLAIALLWRSWSQKQQN
jgi:hypothetical protein